MQGLLKKIRAYRVSFEISAGCVLLYRSSMGNRYLLLQYPHGHWDFVKGHVEKGESVKQALLRETEEEVGITPDALTIIPGFQKKITYAYRAKGTEKEKRIQQGSGLFIVKRVIFFLVESKKSGVSLSHEHIGSAWLPYADAVNRATFGNAKRILEEAEEFLKT